MLALVPVDLGSARNVTDLVLMVFLYLRTPAGGTDAMTVYEVEPKMPSYFELGCAEDHDLHRVRH